MAQDFVTKKYRSKTQSKRDPKRSSLEQCCSLCSHCLYNIARNAVLACQHLNKPITSHACGFRCFCYSEAFVSLCLSTTPLTSCSITRLATRKAPIPRTQSFKRGPLCYQTSWRKRIRYGSGLLEIQIFAQVSVMNLPNVLSEPYRGKHANKNLNPRGTEKKFFGWIEFHRPSPLFNVQAVLLDPRMKMREYSSLGGAVGF